MLTVRRLLNQIRMVMTLLKTEKYLKGRERGRERWKAQIKILRNKPLPKKLLVNITFGVT